MKITIERAALRAALDVAQTAVKSRSTLPVLENVLFCATPDGGLIVAGTDLETRAWHTVAADVTEAGSVTLPPGRVSDFLDAVPDGATITLSVNEQHKAELTSGQTRARIAGIDAEQFPPAIVVDALSLDVTLGAADFADAIDCVAHALAKDASRPALAGIFLRIRDRVLTLVAADGYRLAIVERPLEATDAELLIHGRTLATVAGRIAKATSVRLTADDGSHLLIDSEVGCWAARLIDGQFPDFTRIIPRDTPIAVTAAKADLLRAMKLIRRVDETAIGYRVNLAVSSHEIEVRAASTDGDQAADTLIGCRIERGTGLSLAFNATGFQQAIEAIDADQVTLEMTRADTPCLIHPEGRQDNRQVVMPMHDPRSVS